MSMRIMRNPEGSKLCGAPAKGNELDDENGEYADESYR